MNTVHYLQRIAYTGDTSPTLATLQALQKAHMLAVPFENLDIHLKRPMNFEAEALYQKVVEDKRGGFCYELNGLYYHLLKALGFNVKRLAARVYNPDTRQFGPPFDHLTLLVTLPEGKFLTDVGFGDYASHPLPLTPEGEYQDSWGLWRFTAQPYGEWELAKQTPKGWVAKYRFSVMPHQMEEYMKMAKYQQYDPNSHFGQRLLITRPTENGRITLTHQQLKIREGEQVTETPVPDLATFESLLTEYFDQRLSFPPKATAWMKGQS